MQHCHLNPSGEPNRLNPQCPLLREVRRVIDNNNTPEGNNSLRLCETLEKLVTLYDSTPSDVAYYADLVRPGLGALFLDWKQGRWARRKALEFSVPPGMGLTLPLADC